MNGNYIVTLIIILLTTVWIMPTLDYHLDRLEVQADARVQNLHKIGR